MKIIAAWDCDSKELLEDKVIKKDQSSLERKHVKALKKDPTWAFFGGVLSIGTRRYQVVEIVP